MKQTATRIVYLSGKVKWARLIQPDLKYNCWSVVLYPNDESYKTLMDMKEKKGDVEGLLNVIKKDDDGYNITLKREVSKEFNGKLTALAPPLVLDADGAPFDKPIGNGSDLTLKIEYRKYNKRSGGQGTAIRLVSARIDNLVPYDPPRDFDEDQTRQAKGLIEQPAQSGF